MQQGKQNSARLWKPDTNVDITLFKATFTTFSYDRHTHEEYALGVIEQGVQQFRHKGNSYQAPPMSLITVNPDEVHDGEAFRDGYTYRMIYVGESYLHGLFGEEFGRHGLHGFSAPTVHDPVLGARLHQALFALDGENRPMDELLAPVLFDLFDTYATPRPMDSPMDASREAVSRAVEHIHANVVDAPSLESLAAIADLSKFHFLRMFKRQTGLTPHAYIVRHRVHHARKAMEQGSSPAEAAISSGFADQSHLTRRFKAMYGVTPGSFVRAF